MKQILSFLILLTTFTCCKTLSGSGSHGALMPKELPETISYSKGFNLFWLDLSNELTSCPSWEKFKPSKVFIIRNQLIAVPTGYAFRAYVKTNAVIPLSDLSDHGIQATLITDSGEATYSVLVPLQSVPKLLDNPAVIYIEKALPVYPK